MGNNQIINTAKEFAIDYHYKTNHRYDNQPYSVHLNMVYDYALKYSHLVDNRENILASAWTHDLIEDCRLTYNDIKNTLNEEIAEITYALTNEKGKTRKERANDKYYDGIRAIHGATFIKLCDRLANVKYSKENGSRMHDLYKKEQRSFYYELYSDEYEEMWQELDELLEIFD